MTNRQLHSEPPCPVLPTPAAAAATLRTAVAAPPAPRPRRSRPDPAAPAAPGSLLTLQARSRWKSRARRNLNRKESCRGCGQRWPGSASARRRSSATALRTRGEWSGSSLRQVASPCDIPQATGALSSARRARWKASPGRSCLRPPRGLTPEQPPGRGDRGGGGGAASPLSRLRAGGGSFHFCGLGPSGLRLALTRLDLTRSCPHHPAQAAPPGSLKTARGETLGKNDPSSGIKWERRERCWRSPLL